MVVLILLQRSEGGALGIGGGGGGFVSGRGAANFMTRATAILATIFFATAILLGVLGHRSAPSSAVVGGSCKAPLPGKARLPRSRPPWSKRRAPFPRSGFPSSSRKRLPLRRRLLRAAPALRSFLNRNKRPGKAHGRHAFVENRELALSLGQAKHYLSSPWRDTSLLPAAWFPR